MIKIGKPEWRLKNKRCPCAGGCEGSLLFITCPKCGNTVLVCDEVGTVFPNPHNLDEGPYRSWLEMDVCFKCNDVLLSKFVNSSAEDIQKIGFRVGEYD